MKSSILLACALAALVAPTATAVPAQWSVSGSGHGGGGVTGDIVAVGAHSDPGGADPRGHVEAQGVVTTNDVAVSERINDGGDVTCLNVVGNRAVVVWKLRDPIVLATQPGFAYTYGVAYIEDNGEPVDGQPVDRMVDAITADRGRDFFCGQSAAESVLAASAAPLVSGNYVVDGG